MKTSTSFEKLLPNQSKYKLHIETFSKLFQNFLEETIVLGKKAEVCSTCSTVRLTSFWSSDDERRLKCFEHCQANKRKI